MSEPSTHAMCDWYGHDWKKNALLTSRQSAGYRVDVCQREGCDAARRVYEG